MGYTLFTTTALRKFTASFLLVFIGVRSRGIESFALGDV
jgi:hypothetical protein